MNRNFKEMGTVMIIFGLSMILFPFIFVRSTNYHFEYPDNIYMGIILIIFGILALAKDSKKHNDKK